MKLNRVNKITLVVMVALMMIVGFSAHKILNFGAQDIKIAKEFMKKIYSIDAVDKDIDLNDIKYESVKKLNTQNELVHKTILTQSYGIDIDKNGNVIGFAKKEVSKNIKENYTIDEAKEKAKIYLDSIYHESVILKNIISEENGEKLPYYSFVFVKEKDNYPFYFDEIKVNINKENGFLDGYSNTAMQKEYKEPNIQLYKNEAEQIALDTFNKYNENGEVVASTDDLVFSSNFIDKDVPNTEELCYMVTIQGNDLKNNSIEWKIFVNSENKTIFNILKDGVEKKVTTKNS